MTEHTSVGSWVRARRVALDLSQKRLAKLLGCSPVTVQKIEEGRRRPSPVLAEALAKHLDLAEEQVAPFLLLARTAPPVPRVAPAAVSSEPLPAPLTPLIGRVEELVALTGYLQYGERRLVTLTGPPGVGKTRLGLEAARALVSTVGEVRFVPLASLSDPARAWPEVARRLKLSDAGRKPALDRLAAHWQERPALLVLDNFEHLLDAAPGLVALMERAPALRILVTSREALRVTGEQVWPLEPLALPASGKRSLSALLACPAVALFVDRAHAIAPHFTLAESDAEHVAEIVARLDGLPLALELASARAGHLRPAELAEQLRATPFAPLGDGPRDAPARQRTLHAAIAWSYERLPPDLQCCFRHLGVMAGRFTAKAAASVARAGLKDFDKLLAAHLVGRDLTKEGYELLETLRAFALDRLVDQGELEAAAAAHARYFLEEFCAPQGVTMEDNAALEGEVDNLRAALRWFIDQRDSEAASRLAVNLRWFWETRGLQREGLEWFEAALALPGEVEVELRLQTIFSASTLAWQLGLFEQAVTVLLAGLDLTRASSQPVWERRLLFTLGRVEVEQGHADNALAPLQRALELCQGQEGNGVDYAGTLFQLADAHLSLGKVEQARVLAEQGLAVCLAEPGMFWEQHLQTLLGEVALHEGDTKSALACLTLALNLSERAQHTRPLTLLLAVVARAIAVFGEEPESPLIAARLWSAVATYREAAGLPLAVAHRVRIDAAIAQARARAPQSRWHDAWMEGMSWDLAKTVERARDALHAVSSERRIEPSFSGRGAEDEANAP
ncbi:ATP-binding protein [Deinococcus yavapaiensis]|uniref:Putative ATPase n=1 Tax=Deinococcus yavapaiensis KR-236 TaxID=694435 RepID=A0A318S443_9DEIO|nr:helix-turn-helix domain-containing protein [Deinococcus yavapaiensis]PYE53179.1 putative ATPase [Deinococcus yavapaiensis KR-236]